MHVCEKTRRTQGSVPSAALGTAGVPARLPAGRGVAVWLVEVPSLLLIICPPLSFGARLPQTKTQHFGNDYF